MKLRVSAFFFMILFCSCQSKSQSSKPQISNTSPSSMNWQSSIDSAAVFASKFKKILFVECYSPTCPVCQSIEPFFKNKDVISEYNNNFINYKLDVGIASNVAWLNSRKIYLPSFPQFLFFDEDGKNLIHQSEVIANSTSIINVAEIAKDSQKRAGNYKKRFENGERGMEFLVQAASFARISMDSSFNEKASLELFNIFPKDQMGSVESWAITKKCITTVDNGFAKFWLNNVELAAKFETNSGHQGNEKNILGGIIQYSLFSPLAKFYTLEKLNLFRKYMANTGAGQYSDTYLWEHEVKAAIKEGKPKLALNIGEKIANKYIQNGQSLIYITKVFNDNFLDNSYIVFGKTWLAKAKNQINKDNFFAEYYFELSRLNLREGDKKASRENINNAINYAMKAKIDMKKFVDFSALL